MADILSTGNGAATSQEPHGASTCRWAEATVFLAAPFWFDAEQRPWACIRHAAPRVLETTEVCALCSRWEPRPAHQRSEPADAGAASANPGWLDWISGYPAPHETDRSS